MRSTVRAAATWWVPGLSAVLVLLVLWQSRALRPIQDDYDMALYALEGPIGGTYLRWSDWSGDVWTNLINVVFVGLPLVHLPLWAGSLVPFALTAGTAVLLVLVISIPRFPALRRLCADGNSSSASYLFSLSRGGAGGGSTLKLVGIRMRNPML